MQCSRTILVSHMHFNMAIVRLRPHCRLSRWSDSQCKVYNYIKLCLRAPESHLISTCISLVYFALTMSREVSVWYCVVLINLLDSLVLPSQLIPLRHAKPVRNHCIPKKLLLYSLFYAITFIGIQMLRLSYAIHRSNIPKATDNWQL